MSTLHFLSDSVVKENHARNPCTNLEAPCFPACSSAKNSSQSTAPFSGNTCRKWDRTGATAGGPLVHSVQPLLKLAITLAFLMKWGLKARGPPSAVPTSKLKLGWMDAIRSLMLSQQEKRLAPNAGQRQLLSSVRCGGPIPAAALEERVAMVGASGGSTLLRLAFGAAICQWGERQFL